MEGPRIPKWESRLWTLVSDNDGVHCPTRDHCRTWKRGGLCCEDLFKFRHLFVSDVVDHKLFDTVRPEGLTAGSLCRMLERLADRNISDGTVQKPPVPDKLIEYLRTDRPIYMTSVPLFSSHSAVWRLENRWMVFLNNRDTSEANRFGLFHEAFHILAHSQITAPSRQGNNLRGSFFEGLADYFAMAVLMPRGWVHEKWTETPDATSIAQLFKVTESTAFLRLRQLGLV